MGMLLCIFFHMSSTVVFLHFLSFFLYFVVGISNFLSVGNERIGAMEKRLTKPNQKCKTLISPIHMINGSER